MLIHCPGRAVDHPTPRTSQGEAKWLTRHQHADNLKL
jgi:hypothetical protein